MCIRDRCWKAYPFLGQYSEQFCEHNKKWKVKKQTRFVYNISVKLEKQSTTKKGNELISVRSITRVWKQLPVTDQDIDTSMVILGTEAENYLRQFASKEDVDKTFGLYDKHGEFFIGDSPIKIEGDDIIIWLHSNLLSK